MPCNSAPYIHIAKDVFFQLLDQFLILHVCLESILDREHSLKPSISSLTTLTSTDRHVNVFGKYWQTWQRPNYN